MKTHIERRNINEYYCYLQNYGSVEALSWEEFTLRWLTGHLDHDELCKLCLTRAEEELMRSKN